MAEVINTKVFDVEKKFVDFAGLDYFWEKAKAYVDGADATLTARAKTLEDTVNGYTPENGEKVKGLVEKVAELRTEVNALGGAEGGIKGMIDASIAELDVTDAAVDNQYVSSVSQADGKITVSRVALPDWTGAINTAAGQALTDAKAYTDETVGTWTAGEIAGTGLRKEIEEKVAAVAADAKSYSVVAVTGDELSGLGANVKEAYKLVDEDSVKSGEYIKIYKDSALQKVELVNQELQFTYLLADGTSSMVPVSVATFLAESEFGDGLQVNAESGVVSVKVDAASESFLTVGADGIKLSGVQAAIDTAAEAAEAAAKTYADGLKTTIDGVIEENERVTSEALTDLDTRVKTIEGTIEGQDVYVKSEVDAAIAEAKKAGTDAAAAVTALANGAVKTNTDAIAVINGNAETEGSIAKAKADAIADAEGKLKAVKDTLKSAAFVEVATLEATMDSKDEANLAAAKTYAATYTDELFNSIKFASNDDIDAIFA